MNKTIKLVAVAATLLLCVAVLGCNGKNPQGRKAVQGTITLDGEPIKAGTIEFTAVAGNEPEINAGAKIVDGKYSIVPERGLVDGSYTVSLSYRVDTGETEDTGMGPQPIFEEKIPAAYGSETEQQTSFSGKGPFVFDLDVPSN